MSDFTWTGEPGSARLYGVAGNPLPGVVYLSDAGATAVLKRLYPIERFAQFFYLGLAVLILFFAMSVAATSKNGWQTASDFLHVAGCSFLVASAAATVGCLIGFLFGIPRTPPGLHILASKPEQAQSEEPEPGKSIQKTPPQQESQKRAGEIRRARAREVNPKGAAPTGEAGRPLKLVFPDQHQPGGYFRLADQDYHRLESGSVSQLSPDAKGRRHRRSKVHCAQCSGYRRRLAVLLWLDGCEFPFRRLLGLFGNTNAPYSALHRCSCSQRSRAEFHRVNIRLDGLCKRKLFFVLFD
jgi:hypothetical protein